MEYSVDGLNLTKKFEGCSLEAYPDPATGGDPWTIGYGHTGPEVHKGLVWTQEQCDAALLNDIKRFSDHVNSVVKVELTQGMFDALVDFTFNVGTHNLNTSTLLKLINKKDFDGAAEQFKRWNHANGKVMAGLTKRRLAEKNEFLA